MATYRHTLVATHRSQRVAPKGLKAVVEWLNFSSYAMTTRVVTEDGWTTYTLEPGPYAHNLFVEGDAPSEEPAFRSLVLAAGDSAQRMTLGEADESVFFYLCFEDARFETLLDDLGHRLHQVMVVRTEAFRSPAP